jgi:hypothetical protein
MARTFEDKVNSGYYLGAPDVFARDARSWLRERIPHRAVNKVFDMACSDRPWSLSAPIQLSPLEKLENLKKLCELFEPVKIVVGIDDRNEILYLASCDEVQPSGSKPETGWSYEEALGSLIMRMPGRFGFLIDRRGKMTVKDSA